MGIWRLGEGGPGGGGAVAPGMGVLTSCEYPEAPTPG